MRKQDASGYILISIIGVGFLIMLVLTAMFIRAVVHDRTAPKPMRVQEQIQEETMMQGGSEGY